MILCPRLPSQLHTPLLLLISSHYTLSFPRHTIRSRFFEDDTSARRVLMSLVQNQSYSVRGSRILNTLSLSSVHFSHHREVEQERKTANAQEHYEQGKHYENIMDCLSLSCFHPCDYKEYNKLYLYSAFQNPSYNMLTKIRF